MSEEIGDDESIVVGVAVLRGKTIEEKKLILTNRLKNKECTVASVLSTLMNSSQYLIDDSKC